MKVIFARALRGFIFVFHGIDFVRAGNFEMHPMYANINGMLAYMGLVVLSVITYFLSSLRRIYGNIPQKELKRRANRDDKTANTLYQVSRHGLTADYFLLTLSILTGTFAIVIASQLLNPLVAAIFVAGFIYLTFIFNPRRSAKITTKMAEKIAPYVGRLLIKARPYTNEVSKLIRGPFLQASHTGIYEKEDLIDLLEKQKRTVPNRIKNAELDMALHALTLGEKKVKDVMVPRRMIHFIHAEEPVGPVLMNELHDSGFSRFPVRAADDEDKIVGNLFLRDLVERTKPGIVSNIMNPKVYYINETQPFDHVLDAFIKTRHHLFMAVNEFEEIVGLITIEDIIEQIIGHKIVDEFDQYDDVRAVAKKDTTV